MERKNCSAGKIISVFFLSISFISYSAEGPSEAMVPVKPLFALLMQKITGNDFPETLQSTIFDYLKEPNYVATFQYTKPDGEIVITDCVNRNIEQAVAHEKISPQDIEVVFGLNYNQDFHASLTKVKIGDIIPTEHNSPLLAFNPDHPGAWLEPSDAEIFLSTPLPLGIDIEKAEGEVLSRLAITLKRDPQLRHSDLIQEPYKHLTAHDQSWLARLKQKVTRRQQPFAQKKQPSTPTYFDRMFPALPPEIKDMIFGWLQRQAKKQSMTLMTPCGLMLWEAHRNVTPWESIDCIEGVDEDKRRHLFMDQASTFQVPPHFCTVRIVEQKDLQHLANGHAKFFVPGPEEIALKSTPIKKSKLQQLRQLKKMFSRKKLGMGE